MQYLVLGMKAPLSDDSLLKGDLFMKRFDIFSRIKQPLCPNLRPAPAVLMMPAEAVPTTQE